jgi:hypothetical protein
MERGNETKERESWSRGERRQGTGRIGQALQYPPHQITERKQQLLTRAADVFGGTKAPSEMSDLKTLHAKIGQLVLENDCLEGGLPKPRR